MGFRSPKNAIEAQPLFKSIDIQSDNDSTDISATWIEEKTIRQVMPDGKEMSITYKILREGQARIALPSGLVMSAGVGNNRTRLVRAVLTPEESPYTLQPVLLNLQSAVRRKLPDAITPVLLDISIIELPLDVIPSATVLISKCTRHELQHVLRDTNAIVDRITFELQDTSRISITRRGSVRINLAEDVDWQDAFNLISRTLVSLGFREVG